MSNIYAVTHTVKEALTTSFSALGNFGQLSTCNRETISCTVHKVLCIIQHANLRLQFIIDRQSNLSLPSQRVTESIQVLVLIYWNASRIIYPGNKLPCF